VGEIAFVAKKLQQQYQNSGEGKNESNEHISQAYKMMGALLKDSRGAISESYYTGAVF
jgi:hypothetical protein